MKFQIMRGIYKMSEALNQTQRSQITQLHQESGLGNIRLFVPLSDKPVNRYIKQAKTVGIDVLGEEIILFVDTTKRGNGKDGILLTNQFFHTSIGYDRSNRKSNLVQRAPYEAIKEIYFDSNQGQLIITVESDITASIGSSQFQIITTQPIAKLIIDVIETIRGYMYIASEKQKQERASGTVVTCTGCKANVNTVDQFCPYCRTEIINPNAGSDSGMNFDSLFGSMNNMFGDNGFKIDGFSRDGKSTTTSSTTTTTVSTENGKTVTKTTTTNN